jgi:nucleotidyltransferase substrate binding protein (TIGR01987 family)
MSKFEKIKSQLASAIKSLEQVLQQNKDAFMRDSSIQRFEYTFDLAWKAIKVFLEEVHGIRCASPKKCFRDAFKVGLIDYEELWLTMCNDRNDIAHMYRESFADELYDTLPSYLSSFQNLQNKLN